VKNGWDALEWLTAANPMMPIIITARSNQLFKALGAGVGAWLEKPLDIPRLLQTVNAVLTESVDSRWAGVAGHNEHFHFQPAAN
jgi:DNA-binding response OmpR family regulator